MHMGTAQGPGQMLHKGSHEGMQSREGKTKSGGPSWRARGARIREQGGHGGFKDQGKAWARCCKLVAQQGFAAEDKGAEVRGW